MEQACNSNQGIFLLHWIRQYSLWCCWGTPAWEVNRNCIPRCELHTITNIHCKPAEGITLNFVRCVIRLHFILSVMKKSSRGVADSLTLACHAHQQVLWTREPLDSLDERCITVEYRDNLWQVTPLRSDVKEWAAWRVDGHIIAMQGFPFRSWCYAASWLINERGACIVVLQKPVRKNRKPCLAMVSKQRGKWSLVTEEVYFIVQTLDSSACTVPWVPEMSIAWHGQLLHACHCCFLLNPLLWSSALVGA